MIKKIFCLFSIFFCFPFLCFSHGQEQHDEYLSKVFFGKELQLKPAEEEKLKLICFSSRIAIDQFNGKYVEELEFLKSKKIRTISSIDEIDYTGNQYHQRYTHRGWTFSYVLDKGHWLLRKQLLTDTTAKVFPIKNENQKDAFSALVYYVHILGDHDGDDITNTMCRIALGGRADKLDILDELANVYIPALFYDQKENTDSVCKKLKAINRKCNRLLLRTGEGFDDRNVRRDVSELTPEEYLIYQNYAYETLKVLSQEIPLLLKNEKWFTKAFPTFLGSYKY